MQVAAAALMLLSPAPETGCAEQTGLAHESDSDFGSSVTIAMKEMEDQPAEAGRSPEELPLEGFPPLLYAFEITQPNQPRVVTEPSLIVVEPMSCVEPESGTEPDPLLDDHTTESTAAPEPRASAEANQAHVRPGLETVEGAQLSSRHGERNSRVDDDVERAPRGLVAGVIEAADEINEPARVVITNSERSKVKPSLLAELPHLNPVANEHLGESHRAPPSNEDVSESFSPGPRIGQEQAINRATGADNDGQIAFEGTLKLAGAGISSERISAVHTGAPGEHPDRGQPREAQPVLGRPARDVPEIQNVAVDKHPERRDQPGQGEKDSRQGNQPGERMSEVSTKPEIEPQTAKGQEPPSKAAQQAVHIQQAATPIAAPRFAQVEAPASMSSVLLRAEEGNMGRVQMDSTLEGTPAPLREVSMKVENAGGPPINLRFIERRGEVHITARTADAGLERDLGLKVDDLRRGLGEAGFASEFTTSGTREMRFSSASLSSGRDAANAGGQNAEHGQSQSGSRHNSPKQEWAEEIEALLDGPVRGATR